MLLLFLLIVPRDLDMDLLSKKLGSFSPLQLGLGLLAGRERKKTWEKKVKRCGSSLVSGVILSPVLLFVFWSIVVPIGLLVLVLLLAVAAYFRFK